MALYGTIPDGSRQMPVRVTASRKALLRGRRRGTACRHTGPEFQSLKLDVRSVKPRNPNFRAPELEAC